MTLRTPSSTLFPYTTLFRSHPRQVSRADRGGALRRARCPLKGRLRGRFDDLRGSCRPTRPQSIHRIEATWRSEEHTSELQSRGHLVCRLLLEKNKKIRTLRA